MSDEKNIQEKEAKSKFWLIISLSLFFLIIFLPIYIFLRSALIYIPNLSEKMAYPDIISVKASSCNLNNFLYKVKTNYQDKTWSLALNENELTACLNDHFGIDWKLDLEKDEIVVQGPLISSLNNPDKYVYLTAKLNEINDKEKFNLDLYFGNLKLPKIVSNYLLEKYVVKDFEKSDDKKYFNKIVVNEDNLIISGNLPELLALKANFTMDNIKEALINYFFR